MQGVSRFGRLLRAINCSMHTLMMALAMATPANGAGRIAVGDSLAVGFGQASHMTTMAKVGVSSCWIAARMPAGHYDFMLISAGTNDVPGRCIEQVRARANADVVEWVVPVNGARSHVLQVAAAHGDRTLFYLAGKGRAWPHPNCYFAVR